jgi:hypothetical protein
MRRSVTLSLLCLMTLGLAAAAETPAPVTKKAGYALIDQYIQAFKSMLSPGSPTRETLNAELDKLMAAAKKSKAAGDIDAVFLSRYGRMVAVTKLITVNDPERALTPIVNAELGRFVLDVLGEDLTTEEPGSIRQVADALAFAFVDLQIYLDTLDSRQERYDKFVKNFNPGK